MTPAEFGGLFNRAADLRRVTLAELQDLAVRFPYSSNIRLLLLLKSRLDGHDQEELYLNRCAAASFDRAFVYDLLKQLEKEKAGKGKDEEEVLELRELDALELEPILMGDETAQTEQPLERFESTAPADPSAPPPPDLRPGGGEWNALPGEDFFPADPPDGSGPAPETEERPVAESSAIPPPASLPSDLQQRIARIRNLQAKRAGEKGKNVNNIARRSIIAHEEVASETLASLLVRQGQYENAIRMYERLILLNPEKKTIFAGLIKELQEKL